MVTGEASVLALVDGTNRQLQSIETSPAHDGLDALAMPDLTTLVQPLIVQIQNSDGLCWEATYGAPASSARA